MPVTVVFGAQWGDEGKGKMVDFLAGSTDVDVVARYQGGANAGHTIAWDDRQFVLHLIPSGIFSRGVQCVIGNGVVVDPVALAQEVRALQNEDGFNVDMRLKLSSGAHLIMPYHKMLDEARERALGGKAIGTTKRGIGPAYEDKVSRTGLRAADMCDSANWETKVREAVAQKNRELQRLYGVKEPLCVSNIIQECETDVEVVKHYVTDTSRFLNDALDQGKHILAEGAQGALLDIDFGTYPYVTSSSPTVGGACTGLGIPPSSISRVIGITKAYCTRVGNGPFPTELDNDTGELLRARGGEFGATTGRPRRCGWLDLVALRYAVRINGITDLVVTKLDVLSGIQEIGVCFHYDINGRKTEHFPEDATTVSEATPIYTNLAGWQEDIRSARSLDDLPLNARALLQFIADCVGVRISMVSVGPRRLETIQTDIAP